VTGWSRSRGRITAPMRLFRSMVAVALRVYAPARMPRVLRWVPGAKVNADNN